MLPKPSSHGFVIGNANNTLVQITDALGKTVYNKSSNNEKIDTTACPEAIYFVLTKGKNKMEQVKFVKKNS